MKFLKVIILSVIFFAFLIIFIPKVQVFNYALHTLNKNNIALKSYIFKDELFSFNLQNSEIYCENIKSANINNLKLNTYILYNNISIKDIKIDDSLKQFVPLHIKDINIKYSILNPLFIDINIYEKEFKVNGYYDILNKKVFLKFKFSKIFLKNYHKLIQELKYDNKTKDYTYEYKL